MVSYLLHHRKDRWKILLGKQTLPQIQALIFDFDGLIIDTESPEFETWVEIFTEFGADLYFEEWVNCLGTDTSAFNPASLLYARTRRKQKNQLLWAEQKRRSFQKSALQPVLPGVREIIFQAKQNGLKLAVASSSPFQWVSTHLENRGLKSFFDYIVTSEQAERVKPHPDLYLKALDLLGLKPGEAIAFEDSPNGIQAARAAEIFCVAIPNPISKRLDLSAANIVLPDLANVSLDELIALPLKNNHAQPAGLIGGIKPSY